MKLRPFTALAVFAAIALLRCNTPNGEDLSNENKRARIDAMYAEYKQEFPEVRDLTPAETEALRASDDAVVVDVRTPEERAVSMLPGAISEEEFRAQQEELADRPIVAHCTIGYRSGLFTEELAAEGFNAFNLAGSILSWVHDGHAVVDPETGEPTRRVHTYGPDWALLPEGYEATW